jgi:2-methylisocitrate lyase-like PEP mutase family enzyme
VINPHHRTNRLRAAITGFETLVVGTAPRARSKAHRDSLELPANATNDVLTRARRYLDAATDCVYPVRLPDLGNARHLDALGNAKLDRRTALADLTAAGVRRLSIGTRAFRNTMDVVPARRRRAARFTPEEVGPDTDHVTRADGVSFEAAPGEMVRHNAPGPSSNQA